MRPPPPQEKPPAGDAYGQQGAYEQDPYAGSQGGYQPDYNQQGYNQVIGVPRLVEGPRIKNHKTFIDSTTDLTISCSTNSLFVFFKKVWRKNWKTLLTTSKSCWFSSPFFQEAQQGQGYAQQGGPTSFSNQMWANRKQVGVLELSKGCVRIPGQYVNNRFFFSPFLFLHRESPEWTNSGSPTSDPQCNTLPFMGWVGGGILEMLRKT